jgi:hypothetical protein
MRSFRQLALIAALFLQLLPVFADDVITNVMSPIVSYQYSEDFSSEVLTNGGVISPFVSYQYPEDFSSGALTNGGIMSPIVSYQYYEWPGNGILNLLNSPVVSYYYQLAGGSGAFVLHGRVTDVHGVALAGATVSAMVLLTPAAQATADGSGNYQMPALGPGVYDLWASDSAYHTSIRAVTLSASTAQQDFQLTLLPAAAAVQQITRQPDLSYTIGPMGSALLVFDGTNFVPIVAGKNVPPADRMTVVLTHGWIPVVGGVELVSGVEGWPTNMATQLRTNGVTATIANIVAWDWGAAAKGLLPPEENTPEQGSALGEALQYWLGSSYSHPVHFLGHSLGTMVNAAAANYLHGDRTAGNTNVSPNPWSPELTHMTLFDHAEIASAVGPRVWWDGITAMVLPPVGTLMLVNDAMQEWKPSSPVRFGWMDNYVSMVGFYHPSAVNVALQKAEDYAGGDFVQVHGYPIAWYGLSITNPSDCVLGFQRSQEYDVWSGQPASAFPPSNFAVGSSYHQTPGNSDQLSLELLPWIDSYQVYVPALSVLGDAADSVVSEVYGGTVQAVGKVSTGISDGVQQASQWVSQGFNYAGNAAVQGWETVVDWAGSASLRLTLQTSPGPTSGPHFNGLTPQPRDNGLGGSNSVAMAWVPVVIPSNALMAAFDFTVAGDPVDDVIVCGIGTNDLFSLQAKFAPTNGVSASRLLDVSAWAGTTNEIFFGVMGGTSTNCTVQVENIRFYSLQPPSLSVQVAGGSVVLRWPSTAGGYALECTPTLTGASWQTITNAPAVSGSFYAMTNAAPAGSMFYRLRKQ